MFRLLILAASLAVLSSPSFAQSKAPIRESKSRLIELKSVNNSGPEGEMCGHAACPKATFKIVNESGSQVLRLNLLVEAQECSDVFWKTSTLMTSTDEGVLRMYYVDSSSEASCEGYPPRNAVITIHGEPGHNKISFKRLNEPENPIIVEFDLNEASGGHYVIENVKISQ